MVTRAGVIVRENETCLGIVAPSAQISFLGLSCTASYSNKIFKNLKFQLRFGIFPEVTSDGGVRCNMSFFGCKLQCIKSLLGPLLTNSLLSY